MEVIRRGFDHVFYVPLVSQADTKLFKTSAALASGDFKVLLNNKILTNIAAQASAFTSGGTAVPVVGETMTGDTSGHTFVLVGYFLTSGTWAGGDAAGTIYMRNISDAIHAGETLTGSKSGANVMTVTAAGANQPTALSEVGLGLYAVPITAPETADPYGTIVLHDADATNWCDTAIQFKTELAPDGIVCEGVVAATGSVGACTLTPDAVGTLMDVQVGDIFHVFGVGRRAIKTVNTTTGAVTHDAFLSDPSGLRFEVFASAPTDAAVDFTATEKTSLDTIGDTVMTNYDAATGAEAAALDILIDGLITTVGVAGAGLTAIPSYGCKKNTAKANFPFVMRDSAGHLPATGKTVSAYRSIDGGAFAACNTATATEVSAGVYKLNLAASDLNGDTVILRFTATACDDLFVTILTES